MPEYLRAVIGHQSSARRTVLVKVSRGPGKGIRERREAAVSAGPYRMMARMALCRFPAVMECEAAEEEA
jgi:hypothetical protein